MVGCVCNKTRSAEGTWQDTSSAAKVYASTICYAQVNAVMTSSAVLPAWSSKAERSSLTARVGLIDRCTSEGSSLLDALQYACHPRLVNGYMCGK